MEPPISDQDIDAGRHRFGNVESECAAAVE
jgi:hypothetical protein